MRRCATPAKIPTPRRVTRSLGHESRSLVLDRKNSAPRAVKLDREGLHVASEMLSHTDMQTRLFSGSVVTVTLLALAMLTGCGPGLTRKAKAPTDVFQTMDAELSHAIGTAQLTSEEMPLPESRMPLAQWDEDEDTKPVQTWGVPAAPIPVDREALLRDRE
jgi:hypothetical protein